MKVLLITACLALLGLGASLELPENVLKVFPALAARYLSLASVETFKYVNQLRQNDPTFLKDNFWEKHSDGTLDATIFLNITLPLPTLPDPISLIPLEIPPFQLNETISETVLLGFISLCEPALRGLSDLQGTVNISYDITATKMMTLDFYMKVPSFRLESRYLTHIFTNFTVGPDIHEFGVEGEGHSFILFPEFFIKFIATGMVAPTSGEYLSLDALEFDWGLENDTISFENMIINGVPVPGLLEGVVKGLHTTLWPTLQVPVVALTRCAIDHMVNDCTPLDLLSGVYDCLKFDFLLKCLGGVSEEVVQALTPREGINGLCNPDVETTTTTEEATTDNETTTSGEPGSSTTTTSGEPETTASTDPETTTTTSEDTSSTTEDNSASVNTISSSIVAGISVFLLYLQ